MPVYEFQCKKCDRAYEALTPYDPAGKYKGVACEFCGSKRKTKLMTASQFQFTNPVDTGRWNSETSGHEYRFKHNLPSVLEQRKQAEIMSHMGADPYGSTEANDLNLGEGLHDAEYRTGLT